MRFESGGSNPEQCRRFGYRSAINDSERSSGIDLISDALPFGRLWYGEANAASNAVCYAKFFSRSRDAVIRVYDDAGNVIQTPEHPGDFKQWQARCRATIVYQ
jgi:hypothetical protein